MRALGVASKINADLDFLLHLKELAGRRPGIGSGQTGPLSASARGLDIRATFLDAPAARKQLATGA